MIKHLAVPFLLIPINIVAPHGGVVVIIYISEVKMGHRTTKTNHKVKVHKTVSYRIDFFYYAFCNILIVIIPLVIISALLLSLPHSSANDSIASSDELTLTLSSSCTLRSEVEKAHTATLNSGQYEGEIGTTRVNTYCNDNNGYSIYAIGSSNNVDGNTDLVSNINDNYNISTGLYNSSTITPSSPSTWSMKLTAGTGTGINPDTGASVVLTPPNIVNGFNNYSLVPSTYTLVASRSSATDLSSNTDVTGSYFTTTYDIYASSYQPAGTYSGKVKYAILHPYSNSNIVDFSNAFARAGKEPVTIPGSGVYYKMQDMNTAICNAVNIYNEASAIQLVDIRDNNTYWVSKLEDGHCWMTQNLDFDIDTTKTYTHNDTDLGWDPNSFDSNATWKPDTTNGKYNLPVNGTSVPNWSNQNTYPYSADPGDVYYYTSNSNDNDIKYNSLSECIAADHTEGDCKHYHAGNYYNWTAAIASNNSSSLTTQYANAPNSICPKGWRLPYTDIIDNSHNEFGRLLYDYNITNNIAGSGDIGYKTGGFNTIRVSPLWFVRSGSIHDYTLTSSGFWGSYWSNTVEDELRAYDLVFNDSRILLTFNYNRYYGWSVRCLAR